MSSLDFWDQRSSHQSHAWNWGWTDEDHVFTHNSRIFLPSILLTFYTSFADVTCIARLRRFVKTLCFRIGSSSYIWSVAGRHKFLHFVYNTPHVPVVAPRDQILYPSLHIVCHTVWVGTDMDGPCMVFIFPITFLIITLHTNKGATHNMQSYFLCCYYVSNIL